MEQNAQTLFLKTIENLIMEDEVEKALEELLKFDEQAQAEIRDDLILMKARLKQMENSVKRGIYEPGDKEYLKVRNSVKASILDTLESIPGRVALYAGLRSQNGYNFKISGTPAGLEKIIGSKDNLVTIGWMEKALQVSRAVCRVVRADQEMGTGFLTQDGYLFTNNHVLQNEDEAKGATIEFNYEVGISGNVKPSSQYKLDASDFVSSPVPEYDFTRVKVIDNAEKPLNQWGFLEIDSAATPVIGDAVAIIQHASGGDKRMALRANEVLEQQAQFLYYTTDTEPGSSGSPVFNRDWKVVALHHAGKKINGRDANEGILFKNILDFIAKK